MTIGNARLTANGPALFGNNANVTLQGGSINFNGDATFLSPVLRPVEAAIYWAGGVDPKREQHWRKRRAPGGVWPRNMP